MAVATPSTRRHCVTLRMRFPHVLRRAAAPTWCAGGQQQRAPGTFGGGGGGWGGSNTNSFSALSNTNRPPVRGAFGNNTNARQQPNQPLRVSALGGVSGGGGGATGGKKPGAGVAEDPAVPTWLLTSHGPPGCAVPSLMFALPLKSQQTLEPRACCRGTPTRWGGWCGDEQGRERGERRRVVRGGAVGAVRGGAVGRSWVARCRHGGAQGAVRCRRGHTRAPAARGGCTGAGRILHSTYTALNFRGVSYLGAAQLAYR